MKLNIQVNGMDLDKCEDVKLDLPKIKLPKIKSETFLIPANKKNADLNLSKELIEKLLK